MSEPTIDEAAFAELPFWVAVAFAARCARLVFPQLRKMSRAEKTRVARAIEVAEQLAYAGAAPDGYSAEADADLAVDVAGYAKDPKASSYADAAGAAAYAAGAAADVARKVRWANPSHVHANARRAVLDALVCDEVAPTIRAELDALFQAARAAPLDRGAPCPRHWIANAPFK